MSRSLNVGIDLGGHTVTCATMPSAMTFSANVNVVTTNNGNYIRQYKSGTNDYVRIYYKGNLLSTLYRYNGTTTAKSSPVLLPDDFGVINSVDESAVSYQYLQRDGHIKVYGFTEDLDKVEINEGTSLEPDVLFEGDSNGTITLTKDVSAYKYVRVYYRDDDNTHKSDVLYSPQNKQIELTTVRMSSSFAYIKVRRILISGSQISDVSASYGNLQVYPSIRFINNKTIYITRVEAWN